jgi:hypothetical protein
MASYCYLDIMNALDSHSSFKSSTHAIKYVGFWREHQNILFNTFNTLCSNEPSKPTKNTMEQFLNGFIHL